MQGRSSSSKNADHQLPAPIVREPWHSYTVHEYVTSCTSFHVLVHIFLPLCSYETASEHIEKINSLESLVAKHRPGFGSAAKVFAHSMAYSSYKTMEVISSQLLRNLLLVLACVLVATLLLLADIIGSLIVVASVSATLVDLAGAMYFWGLALDTSAAVLLTLAVGLAVDYCAHLAHAFMIETGDTRDERVREALVHIGPAILNGGVSTFLAFVMLVSSESYVFKIFFKIFLLIVVLGLYHGLVLLPIVLSFVGPMTSGGPDVNSDKVEHVTRATEKSPKEDGQLTPVVSHM